MNICRNCIQARQWREDQKKYDETSDEEYDYTSPCIYCSLNNVGYT